MTPPDITPPPPELLPTETFPPFPTRGAVVTVVAVRAAVRITPPTEGRLTLPPLATRPAETGIDGIFAGRGIAATGMLCVRIFPTVIGLILAVLFNVFFDREVIPPIPEIDPRGPFKVVFVNELLPE